ncbi:MAG: RimK/LysX family protein [Phormidesmis sp.]
MHQQFVQSLPARILSFLAISLLAMFVVIGMRSAVSGSEEGADQTIGWVENARMVGVEPTLKSKIDTGATTTSINAEVLAAPNDDVESGGVVKFHFVDSEGNKTLFERPLERWVKIKDEDRRPVVQMRFCIAGKWMEGEVSLAERDNFNYAVLIGRNLLKKSKQAVDSSQTFTAQPNCESEAQS